MSAISESSAFLTSFSAFVRSASSSFLGLVKPRFSAHSSSSPSQPCLAFSPSSHAVRRLERLGELLDALLALGAQAVEDLVDFLLELCQVLRARLFVNVRDDGSGEVEDLLELLRSHVDQVADPRGNALEEPDVGDGRGQVDVAHALAADLRPGDLDAAALADDALVADPLVLAAVALPVLGGTEDALAEEAVLLRLERPVVDRLRLRDLTVATSHGSSWRKRGRSRSRRNC